MYIVELEPGVHIASWQGDPGRTLVKGNALTFETEDKAEKALLDALGYRNFYDARIIKID